MKENESFVLDLEDAQDVPFTIVEEEEGETGTARYKGSPVDTKLKSAAALNRQGSSFTTTTDLNKTKPNSMLGNILESKNDSSATKIRRQKAYRRETTAVKSSSQYILDATPLPVMQPLRSEVKPR